MIHEHSSITCDLDDCPACDWLETHGPEIGRLIDVMETVEPIVAEAERVDRALNPPPRLISSDHT